MTFPVLTPVYIYNYMFLANPRLVAGWLARTAQPWSVVTPYKA